ncbi:MAG: hypothetical protein SFT68_02135 [Rickettsiaceae bacterium]|nr:hypothetical protein [Rickettsiaceae bacterium]
MSLDFDNYELENAIDDNLLGLVSSDLSYYQPVNASPCTLFETLYYGVMNFFGVKSYTPSKCPEFHQGLQRIAHLCSVDLDELEIEAFYKTNEYSWLLDQRPAGYVIKIPKKDDQPSKVIVAYHGTMSNSFAGIIDVIDDLSILPNQNIHSGFLRAFMASANTMQATLDSMIDQEEDTQIIFTGHSLGGALAEIAAFNYVTNNSISKINEGSHNKSGKINVALFGCPAAFIGKKAYEYNKLLDKNTAHISVEKDPIVSLSGILNLYQFVGGLTILNISQIAQYPHNIQTILDAYLKSLKENPINN